ncbi:FMN-binding protein [Sulfuricaulis sp.]|uniref:FMN-binding protein n=1 Tax=Sulfuricaulis sp. TaxID=2003553 RepID=UPI003559DF74
MSSTQPMASHSPASRAMIITLGGVALLSGFLLTLVYQLTLPYIEANQRLAVERAVLKIYPQTETRVGFVLSANGLRPAETAAPGEILVHAAYDKTGELHGLVAEAAAHGYSGVIRLLYGYSPECQCITGISVLQSTETPGFGDKISTDPDFLANFRALDVRLNPEGSALRHSIVTVKHGTKTEDWQVDAISGATITSKAVGRMLNQSAQALLPGATRDLDKIRSKP